LRSGWVTWQATNFFRSNKIVSLSALTREVSSQAHTSVKLVNSVRKSVKIEYLPSCVNLRSLFSTFVVRLRVVNFLAKWARNSVPLCHLQVDRFSKCDVIFSRSSFTPRAVIPSSRAAMYRILALSVSYSFSLFAHRALIRIRQIRNA
jgi:hypothetical protein